MKQLYTKKYPMPTCSCQKPLIVYWEHYYHVDLQINLLNSKEFKCDMIFSDLCRVLSGCWKHTTFVRLVVTKL